MNNFRGHIETLLRKGEVCTLYNCEIPTIIGYIIKIRYGGGHIGFMQIKKIYNHLLHASIYPPTTKWHFE